MRAVKSRPGSCRAERASETRGAIEAAARRCFGELGYAATTLREIAREAGVAVQTVYAVFGSKANILRALRLSVVGDREADAAWSESLEAADNEASIAAFARSIRLRWEHGADIVAINEQAARSDPALRHEIEVAQRIRRTGIGGVAEALVARDRSLGDVSRVTAIIEALTVTDAYLVLTGAHGWTPHDYEAWLVDTLSDAVAGPAKTDPGASAQLPGTRSSRGHR